MLAMSEYEPKHAKPEVSRFVVEVRDARMVGYIRRAVIQAGEAADADFAVSGIHKGHFSPMPRTLHPKITVEYRW